MSSDTFSPSVRQAERRNDPELGALYRRIGQRIRDLRDRAGVTQRELAEGAFGHRSYQSSISRWEAGLWLPQLASLERIAEYFGVSVADLGVHDTETLSLAELARIRAHVSAALAMLREYRMPKLRPVAEQLEDALALLP